MLSEMLRLLNDGGIHTTAEMAHRIGISEALAQLMMEDLTRRGYLTALETACADRCRDCALFHAFQAVDGTQASRPLLLMLTAKGRQIADQA